MLVLPRSQPNPPQRPTPRQHGHQDGQEGEGEQPAREVHDPVHYPTRLTGLGAPGENDSRIGAARYGAVDLVVWIGGSFPFGFIVPARPAEKVCLGCHFLSGSIAGMSLQGITGEILAKDYQRVSKDRSGRERSPEEQGVDNRRRWSEFRFIGYYRDLISASEFARKQRDDFPRLLEDLERDRFGAHVLVLWAPNRGSRRVGEWVDLLDACKKIDVKIAVTDHERIYDPANWRDRRTLLEDAVDGEAQVGQMSGVIRRAVAANAEDGKPHGRCPFGYQRRYDETTGDLIAQELHPKEAPIIAELFERLQKGHTLNSIARDFNERGLRTGSGKEWAPEHLRTMAVNPLYIGKRLHRSGRRNRVTASRDMFDPEVTVSDAIWPPIVSESLFWTVQTLLSQPERRTGRPGSGVHFLSYVALCDVCSGPMSMLHPEGERRYRCHRKGHVQLSADDLDLFVEEVILAYLARPDVYELLANGAEEDTELEKIQGEIEQIRNALAELEVQLKAREISPKLAGVAEAQYKADLLVLEERERELSTPSQLLGIVTPGEDVAEQWAELPMSAKRTVAKLLFVPELLGQLRVMKWPRKNVPVHERVRWAKNPQLS